MRGGVLHLAVTQNGRSAWQFHGNEHHPVGQPAKSRAANWWRRRESNRRPKALRLVGPIAASARTEPRRGDARSDCTRFLLAGGDTVALPPTNYGLAAIAGFAAPSYALPTALARSRRPEAAGGRVVGASGLTARRPDGERTVAISRSTWGWTRAMHRSVRCTVCFWTRAMLTSTAISVGGRRDTRGAGSVLGGPYAEAR